MPSNLQNAGAVPQKQVRSSVLYTGRFSSGLWTNRSPLRDATTTRISEKYYGAAGDSLIAGLNTEVTNRLTLARRPGTSVYDNNSYTNVDRFYEFRLSNATQEVINVMVDQSNALYSLNGGVKTLVFSKSSGAGQTYMQEVGNTLYFADGVDNKKWLQSLTTWTANKQWNPQLNPFFTTFIVDENGNLQQLAGSFVIMNFVTVASGILTVNLTTNPIGTIVVGDTITFPPLDSLFATFLANVNLVVTGVFANYLTFDYVNPAVLTYSHVEAQPQLLYDWGGGLPASGAVEPVWSTSIPTQANFFSGGQTFDNSVFWVNKGPTVENWGIDVSNAALVKKPQTNSPLTPVTITGGTSSSSQVGSGSNTTNTVFSGFAGTPVSGNVSVSLSLSSTSAAVQPSLGSAGNNVTLQYSTDSGTTWTSFYTNGGVGPIVIPLTTINTIVSGLSNLNTLQIKVITASFVNAVGGSASLTATVGTVTAIPGIVPTFWKASTVYAAGAIVVDNNFNLQTTAAGGTSAAVQPVWGTVLGGATADNTVTWTLTYLQSISAFQGGYRYAVALVNTIDNTVSNASTLSPATGNFVGAQYVVIPPGAGLPPLNQIDPQADFVAIFRTTDGQAVPFLIPGPGNLVYTVPLKTYLTQGYHDNTPDTGLNNLISGAIAGENTPPAIGATALTYHLNRIFYFVGNVAYWTSGPSTPVGNGVNGTNPLNFDALPSLGKRIVATTTGALLFTVSDLYIIQGNGTASNPLQAAIPLIPGLGLPNYNALDTNGPIIGLFTTDRQFITLDPSAGVSYAGFPIGDQLRLNNGMIGQSWNPNNIYVAWHIQGEDAAWYVCDGATGWYRLMSTPAPETGYTWSPFASIVGGCKAVQSIEVTPGFHTLLIGSTSVGPILQRDLSVFTDNLIPYPANATLGSVVLTQPGQIASVAHIVTDAVKVGSPLSLGLLIDEALPYYTGPVDILKHWISDPPNLPSSNSFWSQRFYLSEMEEFTAACRHMQIQIIFSATDFAQNELLTFSIVGSLSQEA